MELMKKLILDSRFFIKSYSAILIFLTLRIKSKLFYKDYYDIITNNIS